MSDSSDADVGEALDARRIEVLPSALADQIAAGEVVERPASVVKELIENAVDAGARRVEVELGGAGMTSIRVLDDGRGMHPEDLPLAVRRHATSKIRSADELVEIRTLGFRGEALASICAVARTTVRSRRRGAEIGHELRSIPGEQMEVVPVGMPEGTQVEVEHLFASVPARRKFVRSEATEVGHCSDAVTRVALVHPHVHFTMRHEGRKLLDLPRADLRGRMTQVLERRGPGPFHEIVGERDGVSVHAFLAPPQSATRQRKGTFVMVRRRVVSERSLSQIVHGIYGETLGRGLHPVAGIDVEPPRGTVDVNVHPQKAEVRFADAQTVYAAVREILAEGMASAPWVVSRAESPATDDEPDGPRASVASAAAAGWDFAASKVPAAPVRTSSGGGGGGGRSVGYRLGTRATESGYAQTKDDLRGEADRLRARLSGPRGVAPVGMTTAADEPPRAADPAAQLELLTVLPGPVALFRLHASVVVVDLVALRAHLVRRRLERDLGGRGIVSQRLLTPAVVQLDPARVQLCVSSAEVLLELGIEVDAFGDDSVLVRGVPAHVKSCVDDADVTDLMHRVLPWLELRSKRGPEAVPKSDAIAAIARTRGAGIEGAMEGEDREGEDGDGVPKTAARLARQWVRDLMAEDGLEGLLRARGVRCKTVSELLRADDPEDGRS